ncbi:MAG: hypothetical protein WCG08_17010, partial [Paludibacter sp.]
SWTASDQTTFSNQWDVVDNVSDLGFSTNHLQMGWTAGRVIASKTAVATPYAFESDIQVLSVNGSNGGVVVRADAANNINNFQEPGNIALQPNFNSEGIAVFASPDATGLNIQLSEALQPANATVLHRYYIPGTMGVDFRNGVIRIEDYGTSLYVYYAGAAFARIDLADLVGNNYTSATIYNNQGSLVGACSNIVVPQTGKLGVANRFGAANQSINVYRLTVEIPKNVSINSDTNVSTLILAPLSDLVVYSNNLTIDKTTQVNSITVAPGAKLTLTSGNILTAGTVTLQSDATGTATLVDNTTNSPQAVTATVQQYVTQGRNWYISIPLTSGASSLLSRGTSVVCYDEPSGNWIAPAAGTLNKMRGYVETATTTPLTGSTGTVDFTGVLNTGAQSISLTRTAGKTGFNLVGNPYPSYLDWNAVTKTNLSNTMWYRTKEGSIYKFYTYVANSGAGVGSPATVTNKIPPMQAFWVRVNTEGTGSIAVDNNMRSHNDVAGNIIKAPKQSSQQLLRLQVSNGINTDETVIYFNANASDTFDSFDAQKRSNDEPSVPEIFTQVGTDKLVINGMNQIKYNTEIPIGFSTEQANNFSISANEISNFEVGTKVILIDNLNPTVEN